KQAFCDSQFELQHRHYLAHPAPAGYFVVMRDGQPAGRLYLRHEVNELRIVDILIDDALRGRGVGTALLRWLQSRVREQGL
ncbi:GNAT family N-acetyltransferase, partial [Salmonella enterica subsp. enterica serovar Minnesota]